MRNTVVVMHNPINQSIHFCSTALQGQDRWFKFDGGANKLFEKVEQLMVDNGLAHNVTSVQHLRKCGIVDEYQVIYNEPEKALNVINGNPGATYTVCMPELEKPMEFDSLESALQSVSGYLAIHQPVQAGWLSGKLESFTRMAARTQLDGRPALYTAKTLDGVQAIGWHFVGPGVKAGDRFHFDHGVGIQKNEDGFYILIA